MSDGTSALRGEIVLSAVTVVTRARILLAAITAVAVIFPTCEDWRAGRSSAAAAFILAYAKFGHDVRSLFIVMIDAFRTIPAKACPHHYSYTWSTNIFLLLLWCEVQFNLKNVQVHFIYTAKIMP